MERIVIFDNGRTVIRHIRDTEIKNSQIVITFAEMHMNDPEQKGFAEDFLSKNGYDMIVVQKRSESWYQDLCLEEFYRAVFPVTSLYDEVHAYGVSMGAYAVLYFGGIVNAAILAISPLVSIHPKYPTLGHAQFRAEVAYRHVEISEAPKTHRPCLIIYDNTIGRDRLYVESEILPAFPGARVVNAKFFGHPCSMALQETGLLKGLVFNFFNKEKIDPAVDILKNRKKSAHYLGNFIKFLIKRKRRKFSEIILHYSLERFPSVKNFAALQEEIEHMQG